MTERNRPFEIYKSLYFYMVSLLKKQNITEELVMEKLEDLLKYKNKIDIDEFDYSSLRVAAGRLIVLVFLDFENVKSTSILSLLGLATKDEGKFQSSLVEQFTEGNFIPDKRKKIIKLMNKFIDFISNSNLNTQPVLEKDWKKTLEVFFRGEEEDESLIDTLLEKRAELKTITSKAEDLNLRVITDFYSPIITSPFAFKIIDEYNYFLKPLVDEIIKYKHIYSLFEIIMTYEITKMILEE